MKMNVVIAGASTLAVTSFALAGSYTIQLEGLESHGSYGDPDNATVNFNIGAGSEITSISWDNVEGNGNSGPSWGNEMNMFVEDDVAGIYNVTFFPSEGGSTAGGIWGPVSGDSGQLSIVSASGDLTVTFYESYDDGGVDMDASYNSGSVTINWVEIPAPGALALLGIAGIAGTRRRRG